MDGPNDDWGKRPEERRAEPKQKRPRRCARTMRTT